MCITSKHKIKTNLKRRTGEKGKEKKRKKKQKHKSRWRIKTTSSHISGKNKDRTQRARKELHVISSFSGAATIWCPLASCRIHNFVGFKKIMLIGLTAAYWAYCIRYLHAISWSLPKTMRQMIWCGKMSYMLKTSCPSNQPLGMFWRAPLSLVGSSYSASRALWKVQSTRFSYSTHCASASSSRSSHTWSSYRSNRAGPS